MHRVLTFVPFHTFSTDAFGTVIGSIEQIPAKDFKYATVDVEPAAAPTTVFRPVSQTYEPLRAPAQDWQKIEEVSDSQSGPLGRVDRFAHPYQQQPTGRYYAGEEVYVISGRGREAIAM